MTDHPILIPTSKGPVGGIVSEPEGAPHGAVVLLSGGGPPARCGINAIWTRIAQRLAALGVVVLRFDFATEADSAMVGADVPREPAWRSGVDLPITRQVSAWFRERAGMQIVLAGSCYGARLALEAAAEDPEVEGVFLVAPYLAGVRRKRARPNMDDPAERARTELPNPPQTQNDRLSAVAVDSSRAILARGCPLWMLIGEKDDPRVQQLESRLAAEGGPTPEVEIATGLRLHPNNDPRAQKRIAEGIVGRVARSLREREAVG